jgi:hypothetical protein
VTKQLKKFFIQQNGHLFAVGSAGPTGASIINYDLMFQLLKPFT